MNFPLFIARRIHADEGDGKKVSRPAIRIATIGVAIGLAVMIISVCVVLGFKHTIRDKAVGFGCHIVVSEFQSLQENVSNPVCMTDSMMEMMRRIEGVNHVQRFALKQGILKTDSDFLGVSLKGVGPEFDPTFLKSNLVEGELPTFSDSTSSNRLVISRLIANKLRLKTDDKVFAYFMGDDDVRTRRYTIAGIYETNLKHFDETFCFTDLYSTVKLNGWQADQVSGAEVTLTDYNQMDVVAREFIRRVNRTTDQYGATYSSITIREQYPQIFSWLDLLDMNVWIILALMVAVAGFTMISGLLIIILERTNMIGVMKALGAKNRTIRHTFLWFSAFIIGRGMLIGNIIGIGLCVLQKYTGLVHLDPATYYVSTVPVELNIPLIILLNIVTLLVNVLVLIAPSYLISHIHPAKSMRYE
ncbi:MAG: ABC transporter permease [Prevotella sp.]|nr:ABC transporter permease [Prevotella sp.]